MDIKAVIFDLDGTLLDTIGDIGDAMNHVLAQHGLPVHDRSAYLTFVGAGMDVLVRRALPAGFTDEALVPELLARMREEYAKRWRLTSRPYPGIPELLKALTERGIPFSVLSNKLDSFTKEMVRELLGSWEFFEVRGLEFGSPRKPDPAQALQIAGSLQLDPREMLFVGDSGIDMETATRAGMVPVGVLWGYQSREKLVKGGAGILIEEPGELLGHLQGDSPETSRTG
ncbi:MAG TPA: HAD family hydrolase [Deltaproteobacteria bacterium]|nr:HAD family hydrolase [Deltaproteobacteria bacterium]HOI07594.1 HAD family hydrolase [Deltaproteobacteria bacterium]